MIESDDLPGMLAVAKGVAEQMFPHTMDAAVWAAEFKKLNPQSDEGLMLSWFANAIMAGYDTAASRASALSQVGSRIEIRTNADKELSLDEVCGSNVDAHLEQMGATHWSLNVATKSRQVIVGLHSKATIRATVCDEALEPKSGG